MIIALAAVKKSSPRISLKSSRGMIIRLHVPSQEPARTRTSAAPWTATALLFTALILLVQVDAVTPSRCASSSARKVLVAPVSTMALTSWPFTCTRTYINALHGGGTLVAKALRSWMGFIRDTPSSAPSGSSSEAIALTLARFGHSRTR